MLAFYRKLRELEQQSANLDKELEQKIQQLDRDMEDLSALNHA